MSNEDLHTKILAFLAAELSRTDSHQANKIELVYTPAQGFRQEPIRAWDRQNNVDYFSQDDQGHANHVLTNALTAEILELAENHADSYGGGRHRFVLRTHQHLGGRATLSFAVLPCATPATVTDDDNALAVAGGTGSGLVPSSQGLTLQLMRHLENKDKSTREIMDMFMRAMGQMGMSLREENSELRAQLAQKDKERMEWLAQIEEARSKDHERQIEAETVIAKNARTDYAMKKIMGLLPVMVAGVINHKKKTPGKPAKLTPLGLHMAKLFDSLSDEQKDVIEGALDIEQKIMLQTIVDTVQGGGEQILLPTLVNDLVSSLRAAQVQIVIGSLDKEQGKSFVQAMQMAKAQAETTEPPKPEPKQPETEVS